MNYDQIAPSMMFNRIALRFCRVQAASNPSRTVVSSAVASRPRFRNMAQHLIRTWTNQYGDIQMDTHDLQALSKCSQEEASTAIERVKSNCTRGLWAVVDWESNAHLLPVLHKLGFKPHHTYDNWITLQAWCITAPNPTPTYARMNIGVGCVCVNAEGKVLAIAERFDRSGRWLVPGGHLDEAEDWITAAVREAREETGVEAFPLGVCCVRTVHLPDTLRLGAEDSVHAGTPSAMSLELRKTAAAGVDSGAGVSSAERWPFAGARGPWEHKLRWGTGHLSPHALCYAADDTLNPDPGEVSAAMWVDPVEMATRAHPHIAFIVAAALESGQIEQAAALARYHKEHGKPAPDVHTRVPMLVYSTTALQRAAPAPAVSAPAEPGVSSSASAVPQAGTSAAAPAQAVPLDFPINLQHCYPDDILQRASKKVQELQAGLGGVGPVRV